MAAAQKLFEEFTQKVGLEAPGLDGNVATMQFDDMVVNFYIDDEAEEVGVFMNMGRVPVDEAERLAMYSNLLKLNSFGRETGGGILGVDEDDEQISFSRFLSVKGMDLPGFEQELELFLECAESLSLCISGPEMNAGNNAGSEEPETGGEIPPQLGGIRV